MSELIDRKRFSADMRDFQNRVGIWRDEAEDTETRTRADAALATIIETKLILDKQPTVAASPWHRVKDNPPDEKTDAIFYYEWTGISGTVYRETSIISLNELIALGCRPIAWMENPEPPKEDENGN